MQFKFRGPASLAVAIMLVISTPVVAQGGGVEHWCGAETLHEPKGIEPDFGVLRPGLLADMVIVEENPVNNLKVLYGTGAVFLNDETGEVERRGGVKYTIKDGIVYDAKALLQDVADIVERARQKENVTSSGS